MVELPSGLRYEIVEPGRAATAPKPTDTVKVNYTGTLIDGTVFDSSERQGKPIEFAAEQGDRRLDRGPAEDRQGREDQALRAARSSATATTAAPGSRPGSVLVFDVELLDITRRLRRPAPAGPRRSRARLGTGAHPLNPADVNLYLVGFMGTGKTTMGRPSPSGSGFKCADSDHDHRAQGGKAHSARSSPRTARRPSGGSSVVHRRGARPREACGRLRGRPRGAAGHA